MNPAREVGKVWEGREMTRSRIAHYPVRTSGSKHLEQVSPSWQHHLSAQEVRRYILPNSMMDPS